MNGRVLIVSGPSGVGKDTVIEAWQAANPLVRRVVAYTTREPRPGETAGEDYIFVTDSEFEDLVNSNGFLEHKSVHGARYGTPKATVERLLSEGKIAVLKIDVQGALEVMSLDSEIQSVFLLPPSQADLENRLRSRGTESDEKILERLANAQEEMALAHCYDHPIVNDSVAECVSKLEHIVSKVEQVK
ncbi:MAG: guanylate kinase [Chthonomonadaceae bacterium]|nr:guanylate kinase [Chthonomonadaceae bacterium]